MSSTSQRRLPEGFTRTDQPAEGITIDLPAGSAQVLTHGAHLLAWAPAGTGPVLWVSSESRFGENDAVRGGIPICFPWFGPGVSGDRTPAHGVARLAPWKLTETGAPDGVAHLLFTLTSADIADTAAPDALPDGVTAYFSIGLDDTLRLDFTVTAGTEPFTFEEALHTYFSVGDVQQTTVEGLDGLPIFDKAAGGLEGVQEGPVTFSGEVDRVIDHDGAATIVDPVLHRSITIAKRDSASTIVWNPGPEKAAAMADMPDEEWSGFVCVESGNVREHAITLQPGESHTMTVIYTVTLDPISA